MSGSDDDGSVAGVWNEGQEKTAPRSGLSRYAAGPVLGRGGMGTVRSAWDEELLRSVALKSAHTDAGRQAIVHEARVAARLEHPAIVPVYDAGTDAAGAPWFAMRLVRGRSLEHLLSSADRPRRLTLLRHLLAATQAVAFAHSRGVVHRDLKPANVLVGEFGETQVADWGVATLDGHGPTGVVGTEVWMSPEQAAGAQATPAADVYALGRILAATCAATAAEGLDPELQSIITLATAPHAGDRYPDAGGLAADLEARLDNRTVDAHRYSPWERALRLGRRWRTPVLVAAAGLVLCTAALVVGYVRTRDQRDRALLAEAAAAAARDQAETNLAEAWVVRAQAAAAAGDRPEAERRAFASLRLRESAGGRGALIAVDSGPRPLRLPDEVDPGGPTLALGPDRIVVRSESGVRVLDGGARLIRNASLLGDPSAEVLGDGTVLVWSADDPLIILPPGAEPESRCDLPSYFFPQWIVEERPGRWLLGRADRAVEVTPSCDVGPWWLPCGPDGVGLNALVDGATTILCGNRTLSTRAGPGAAFESVPLPASVARSPARIARWGDQWLISTDFGRVQHLSSSTLDVRSEIVIADHPIVGIHPAPDRGAVVLRGDRGSTWIWRPATGERIRLPGESRQLRVEGSILSVAGERVVRWSIPSPQLAPVLDVGVGLSGLAVSPDGGEVVGIRGDGWLSRWSQHDGAHRVIDVAAGRVLKDGAFVEGGFVAARAGLVDGEGPMYRFDDTWARTWEGGTGTARRLAALTGGRWLSAPWGLGGLRIHTPDGAERLAGPGGEFHDLHSAPAGLVVAVAGKAGVVRWRPDGAQEPKAAAASEGQLLPDTEDAVCVAAEDDGIITVAGSRGVRRFDGGRWKWADGPIPAPTAVAAGFGWVAVGDLSGSLHLLRAEGTLVAKWAGHDARVTGLAFVDEATLISSSWDGRLRRWSVRSSVMDIDALARELDAWLDAEAAPLRDRR